MENTNETGSKIDEKIDAVINWIDYHPFITFGTLSLIVMAGSLSIVKHTIADGIYLGNKKTLKYMAKFL